MTPVSATWLAVGAALGMGAAIIGETDLPKREDCQVYRVARKSAVSFVLRPPMLEAAKCEAFNPAPLVTKTAENDTQTVLPVTDETQVEEKPRRHHRRHWRRRYWR